MTTKPLWHRPFLVKQAIKSTGNSLARTVLYNLVRGLPLARGFLPRNSVHAPYLALSRALHAAVGQAKELGIELSSSEASQLIAERRACHLRDFQWLSEQRQPCINALRRAMAVTPHGAHSNVEAHGRLTWNIYLSIKLTLQTGKAHESWPDWLKTHGAALLSLQQPNSLMHNYLVYHDCGKPFVLKQDLQGRMHFPGHADMSALVWLQAGGTQKEARLMQLDMALHTLRCAELDALSKDPLSPSLLLAAYAELQSNAKSIFGGFDSESYKIKLKALNRRAKTLIRHWGLES